MSIARSPDCPSPPGARSGLWLRPRAFARDGARQAVAALRAALALLLLNGMLLGASPALAQSASLQLIAPAAPYVRLRWPDTTLTPRVAGRTVTLTDASGHAVPFTFVIAPEDEGKATHPLWLVFRPEGAPPFTLASTDGGGSAYVEKWSEVVEDSALRLVDLPLATSQPGQSWGPLLATAQNAEASQQASISRWNMGTIALAMVAGIALLAAIGLFARYQIRKEDVTKL
ncbi:hypothetical protein [Chitinasiproducens palmae]|uniref:Transmembrane protein n=1 Tax=Chitinasiproducens palmae TaxID=1770053 RepID=A0A1H2PV03_9BURK|nr:hypothetical protein [Chitinasiproducens palmae]SDV51045.1 hypothetical protein SAMN05216551_114146 [Chitinasiproducens palmae]